VGFRTVSVEQQSSAADVAVQWPRGRRAGVRILRVRRSCRTKPTVCKDYRQMHFFQRHAASCSRMRRDTSFLTGTVIALGTLPGILKERTMAKRVNKVRKSAILEHLLDLERQIRSELARASKERKSADQTEGRSPRSRISRMSSDEPGATRESDGRIMPEVAQRYLH
jgi:hypothetical protein